MQAESLLKVTEILEPSVRVGRRVERRLAMGEDRLGYEVWSVKGGWGVDAR